MKQYIAVFNYFSVIITLMQYRENIQNLFVCCIVNVAISPSPAPPLSLSLSKVRHYVSKSLRLVGVSVALETISSNSRCPKSPALTQFRGREKEGM